MAPVTPVGHPTLLRAGDTWAWRISFADFPVSESWVLSYALTSSSSSTQEPLDWDASWVTNDGAEYTVSIPASTTDDFGKGSYRLTAFVTLASARYSPYSAPLHVEADSASLAAGDGQSHAEATLAKIEASLAGSVEADVESYQINGRALNRIPIAEKKALHARYREMVWKERHPGKPLPGLVVLFPS
jgi:hypothetical protein